MKINHPKSKAIIAFICSILFFLPLTSLIAIILGILVIVDYKEKTPYFWFAVAAVGLGVMSLLVNLTLTAMYIALIYAFLA